MKFVLVKLRQHVRLCKGCANGLHKWTIEAVFCSIASRHAFLRENMIQLLN